MPEKTGVVRALSFNILLFFPNQERLIFEPDETVLGWPEVKGKFYLLEVSIPVKNGVQDPFIVRHHFFFDFYDDETFVVSFLSVEGYCLFVDFEG